MGAVELRAKSRLAALGGTGEAPVPTRSSPALARSHTSLLAPRNTFGQTG
jgi:hypothetical protein